MSFTNACFLSYRHRPSTDYTNFVDDVYDIISQEMSLYVNEVVFRDNKRMQGGVLLDPELALNLCQSACMVMLYIPPYFDENATYCAREYRAMLALETERLKSLNGATKNQGLIIPIICRGTDQYPAELKASRLAYNFESLLLQKRPKRDRQAITELKRITKYIADRVKELKSVQPDLCQQCPAFTLPQEADIKPWVRGVQGAPPALPGRTVP